MKKKGKRFSKEAKQTGGRKPEKRGTCRASGQPATAPAVAKASGERD